MTFFALAAGIRGYLHKASVLTGTRPWSWAALYTPDHANDSVGVPGSNGCVFAANNEAATAALLQNSHFICDELADNHRLQEKGSLATAASDLTYGSFNKPSLPFVIVGRHVVGPSRTLHVTTRQPRTNSDNAGVLTFTRNFIGTNYEVVGANTALDLDYPHFEGDIQWVTIWNVDIGHNLAQSLILGLNPRPIKPANQIACLQMRDGNLRDIRSTTQWTKVSNFACGHTCRMAEVGPQIGPVVGRNASARRFPFSYVVGRSVG